MSFFAEDAVALKEEPWIMGIVHRTWRDIDSIMIELPKDYIYHAGISKRLTKQALKDGRCPRGYVFVNFSLPYSGCSLVSESELILIDRGLSFGDVVKMQVSDAESGTVIRTSVKCDLQPIYPEFLKDQWPYPEKENWLRGISGSDLRCVDDYQEGDYVIYEKDWVGIVGEAYEEVAIRLENGTIVVVENPDELEEPEVLSTPDYNRSIGAAVSERQQLKNGGDAGDGMVPIGFCYPGQQVTTKKWNLRRGKWVLGAYDPSVPPKGIVVDTSTNLMSVNWLSCNVFSTNRDRAPITPPVELDRGDFGALKVYDKGRAPLSSDSTYGPSQGSDIAVGDIVRFQDGAGAAVKYAGQEDTRSGEVQPLFRRIPRTMTQGYDLNVFMVKKTDTVVTVQWQDGSISDEPSINLVPHLNVDDHEVWPGEIVALKDESRTINGSETLSGKNSEDEPDVIRPKEIGVVQSANAKERLAVVRWFIEPKVGVFDDQQSVLLPGSYLGKLGSRTTEVSYYEIVTYPALTKRRGDLVMVAPSSQLLALHSAAALHQASGGSFEMSSEELLNAASHGASSGSQGAQDEGVSDSAISNSTGSTIPVMDPSGSTADCGWFGEIVDLGFDGLLKVRLGALDEVVDIKVPVERVLTVVGGDDDSDFENPSSDDDDSGSSDDWTEDESDGSENVIEETIEYEGGVRQDVDGNDEMWATDDEEEDDEDDDDGDDDDKEALAKPPIDGHATGKPAADTASPTILHPAEVSFSTYSTMPSQFDVLGEPAPVDHKYLADEVHLSANLMRRIRKEYSILKNSLPDGIWARTWADRLDLLRILIMGPQGTPYEFAPMVFDMHFSSRFPHSPPEAQFHSWTNGVGRINPNLYEDGKVCLSLLGTWPESAKHEGWSADGSSLLQILVSIQSLVLVKEPYFNEAGFEALVGTEESRINSALYSEKALVMSKGFIAHALSHKVSGIDEILAWLYLSDGEGPKLLERVIEDSQTLLDSSNSQGVSSANSVDTVTGNTPDTVPERPRLSSGAALLMKRHMKYLKERLERAPK